MLPGNHRAMKLVKKRGLILQRKDDIAKATLKPKEKIERQDNASYQNDLSR